jgi:dihydrofolate synthase/folylpolyglutamate synthase
VRDGRSIAEVSRPGAAAEGWKEVTYREAVAWLYGLQLHGIKLGLAQMLRLCGELGVALDGPERCPAFIHVAGTNGKGSVCAMLDSICREAGIRTGLYTSPHLVTFRERIRLDGAMIPEDAVAAGLDRIRTITETWEYPPTFFEVTTALALEWFHSQKAEVVVLETGLGGRLDATNVVTPVVSVLTPIGLDHQRYLGNSIEEIAGEKCGIIKPGVPVVTAPQLPGAEVVIRRYASERGCELATVQQPMMKQNIGLFGAHQRWNGALASRALSQVSSSVPFHRIGPDAVSRGLANVQWPGRFQQIGDRFILDGAHNPASAEALVATWRERFPQEKALIIIGAMRDKDVAGVCRTLAQSARKFFAVAVGNPRSCTFAELTGILEKQAPSVEREGFENLGAALSRVERESGHVLICGSLFLVGEALSALGLAEGAPETSSQ